MFDYYVWLFYLVNTVSARNSSETVWRRTTDEGTVKKMISHKEQVPTFVPEDKASTLNSGTGCPAPCPNSEKEVVGSNPGWTLT